VLVVNPSLPVKSVKELMDYTKSKAGRVNMASAGAGSQSQLARVLLQRGAALQNHRLRCQQHTRCGRVPECWHLQRVHRQHQ
jgi:tripartite-type tricarboxylate transporter receptor subunit TctC